MNEWEIGLGNKNGIWIRHMCTEHKDAYTFLSFKSHPLNRATNCSQCVKIIPKELKFYIETIYE